MGFSYWVRGSFKQEQFVGSWGATARMIWWTHLGILNVKALVFFVAVEDFKSIWLSRCIAGMRVLSLRTGIFQDHVRRLWSTQIWLWRLVVNTDSVYLRIWGYFPGFLSSCLPALAFFGMRDLFERERICIAFSLLLVNDPSETVSKQLCKK